jgi:hypothetical protein
MLDIFEDFAHAVVIAGAIEDQQFLIHDPNLSTGPTQVSWDGLLAAWADFGYRGAILRKNSSSNVSINP